MQINFVIKLWSNKLYYIVVTESIANLVDITLFIYVRISVWTLDFWFIHLNNGWISNHLKKKNTIVLYLCSYKH